MQTKFIVLVTLVMGWNLQAAENRHCAASESGRGAVTGTAVNNDVPAACRSPISEAKTACMDERGNLEKERQALSKSVVDENRPAGAAALNRTMKKGFEAGRDKFMEFAQKCENQRAKVAGACNAELERLKKEAQENRDKLTAAVEKIKTSQAEFIAGTRAQDQARVAAASEIMRTSSRERMDLDLAAPKLQLGINATTEASRAAESTFAGAAGCGVYQSQTYQAEMDRLDSQLPLLAAQGDPDALPMTGASEPPSATPRSMREVAVAQGQKAAEHAPELTGKVLAGSAVRAGLPGPLGLAAKYGASGTGVDALSSTLGTTGEALALVSGRTALAATGIGTFVSAVTYSSPAGQFSDMPPYDPVVARNQGRPAWTPQAVQANEAAITSLSRK